MLSFPVISLGPSTPQEAYVSMKGQLPDLYENEDDEEEEEEEEEEVTATQENKTKWVL